MLVLFSASRIRYEITQGNIGGAFAVKNETGAIYVAGPLDYESRKEVSDFFKISSFIFKRFHPNIFIFHFNTFFGLFYFYL